MNELRVACDIETSEQTEKRLKREEEATKQNTKQCPGCQVLVFRESGCAAMTCKTVFLVFWEESGR